MIRGLLHSLLYFPSKEVLQTPEQAGLDCRDVVLETDDGERLRGWLIACRGEPHGHLLLLHGNAGNIGDRVLHASVLTAAGFDVLSFDYRGYGDSSGSPSEEGTYRDARAALALIREAIEDCAPPGAVAREGYLHPKFTAQAEALVRGIYAITGRSGCGRMDSR